MATPILQRPSLTVPLEGGAITISDSPFRGRAVITTTRAEPIDLGPVPRTPATCIMYATTADLTAVIDAFMARRDVLQGREQVSPAPVVASPLREPPLGVLTAAELRWTLRCIEAVTAKGRAIDVHRRTVAKIRACLPNGF